ncbi:RNA-binding post-transcriptional regulator cip2 [Erysiphe necator]|uniref:Putative r3h domain protein n=1 Tax=Uncinula necator TaxID=52586 RepID=A0A0B1NY81_UNCNE|nr:RNA-binding post-transcriptional regulator cip2 [Erysiphe necator]KHJ31297.1 putative r3h domain protein [Erysiphe necator]
MAQYTDDAFGIQNFTSNRCPSSLRGSHMIYKQPLHQSVQQSPHLEAYRSGPSLQSPGLYTPEDFAAAAAVRYDPLPRYDRMGTISLPSNHPFDNQTWSYGALNSSSLIGLSSRTKTASRRPGLPNGWMDQQAPIGQNYQILHSNSQFVPPNFHQTQRRSSPTCASESEDLIPTALVIKNIPFSIKKEQMLSMMTDLKVPLPYAFNYHFDGGVFRGLAFANFSSPEETKIVIENMNGLELNGRKLRVEYKKMLPLQERERIERDKREKRGQLEEQHRPIPPGQAQNPLHTQTSMNSIGSSHAVSPSPISMRDKFGQDIDLNDPVSLGYYTDIVVFKKDPNRDSLIFPASISPADRRQIHTMAHHLGLEHRSQGEGEGRCVQILKKRPTELSSPITQLPGSYYNETRRGLNRAATIDFSEALGNENYQRTIGRQSSGLLDIPQSPRIGGLSGVHNLRAAKSFADLPASGTPNLTPTSVGGMTHRDEVYINNNLSNLSLYENRGSSARANPPSRICPERDTHSTNTGAIGSQRPSNGCKSEDTPRSGQTATLSHREPRNPGPDWGAGNGSFSRSRQNGQANRGSTEVDLIGFNNAWDDDRTQEPTERNGCIISRPARFQ